MDMNNISPQFKIEAKKKKDDGILVTLTDESYETKFMSFYSENIDTEKLGIIKGDIFDISFGSNCKAFNIIYTVPETLEDTEKCIKMMDKYYKTIDISFNDYPCFYIIGCDYPNVNKILGNFVQQGFSTCDHLVDFENNHALVKTSKEKLKAMSMYYSLKNKKVGITFGAKTD